MSKSNKGSIKGPSSALSRYATLILCDPSFLREKGIHVPRYNAYGRAVVEEVVDPPAGLPTDVVGDAVVPITSTGESDAPPITVAEEEGITLEVTLKQTSKKKQPKKRQLSDSDNDIPPSKITKKQKSDQPIVPLCAKCNRRMTTESSSSRTCIACSLTTTTKKKTKQKTGLMSEVTNTVPTLQSICIALISLHIDSIEQVNLLHST